MKDTDMDDLLRDVVGGPQLEVLRDGSLTQRLRVLRRRRRRVAFVRASAVAALIALVATVTLDRQQPAALPVSEDQPPIVVSITDEQLLSLFEDRGVALIGTPGDQKLMFLDLGMEVGGEMARRFPESAIR